MNTKPILFGVFALASILNLKAQVQTDSISVQQLNEVYLVDSKTNLSSKHSGKIVKKITKADLESMQGLNLTTIIDRVVGIELSGSKSLTGQNISYKVRGGRNNDVVVLVDGVQVSDPSSINGEFDFRLLKAEQIESIEILKGASSTLYGSGAATAVISITMRAAVEKPLNLLFSSVLGTNQTAFDQNNDINDFREHVNLNGTLNDFTYNLSLGHQYSDGISALIIDTESDAFNLLNKRAEIGYKLHPNIIVKGFVQEDNMRSEIDDTNDLSTNYTYFSDQFRTGGHADFQFNNGFVKLNYAYSEIDRLSESSWGDTSYEAISSFTDIYANYDFGIFSALVGLNHVNNRSKYSEGFESFKITDPYMNFVYISDIGLNINAGFRLNNHSEYGSHFIYNFNPSFNFTVGDDNYFKILSSYSTAYIAPSLDQLFGPWGSNIDLDPEESATFEGGINYNFSKSTRNFDFSLVYFNRRVDNYIDYDYTNGYYNSEITLKTEGVEFDSNIDLSKRLSLATNLTYINIIEGSALRIPNWKLNSTMNYRFSSDFSTTFSYQYNDKREDVYFENFSSNQVTLNDYHLFDFHLNKVFKSGKIKLYASVLNFFNTKYRELYEYNSTGRNYRLGLSLSL